MRRFVELARGRTSATLRPSWNDDDAVAQADQLEQLGADDQRRRHRRRRGRRSCGRSRPWCRRRRRASGRRAARCAVRRAMNLASITFCWLPPDSCEHRLAERRRRAPRSGSTTRRRGALGGRSTRTGRSAACRPIVVALRLRSAVSGIRPSSRRSCGHVDDAAALRLPRTPRGEPWLVEQRDRSAVGVLSAADDAQQLAATGPGQVRRCRRSRRGRPRG